MNEYREFPEIPLFGVESINALFDKWFELAGEIELEEGLVVPLLLLLHLRFRFCVLQLLLIEIGDNKLFTSVLNSKFFGVYFCKL